MLICKGMLEIIIEKFLNLECSLFDTIVLRTFRWFSHRVNQRYRRKIQSSE